ncbi:MAG TPA: aldehyde dehydrogenase family protein, partial [Terriglobales bacterium]|nr:aldehyde dehydrogenase family protein [Terriglobales bacterium]
MTEISIAGVRVSPDHFIANRRFASSRTFEVRSPIDGNLLGRFSAAGKSEVEQAVKTAEKAFLEWAALGPKNRGVYLRRLADLIEQNVEKLATVETINNGSLFEAGRLRVMKRSAHNIRFFAEMAERLQGAQWATDAANAQNRVTYDPAGVTALITP